MPSVRIAGGGRVRVGKIVCVGENYAAHAREMGAPPSGEPIFFLKPSTAIIHDGGTIRIPDGVGEVHHEVELAVVLGSKARGVGPEAALDRVLGYAVAIDVTARDVQRKAKLEGRPWTVSKGYDTFFPLGECVPRGEVSDPAKLVLRLAVNGTVRQEASTSGMVHTVPDLISRVGDLMTLERGDVISTGTPAGVGPLVPGDVVVAELVGLSRLDLKVRAQRPK